MKVFVHTTDRKYDAFRMFRNYTKQTISSIFSMEILVVYRILVTVRAIGNYDCEMKHGDVRKTDR